MPHTELFSNSPDLAAYKRNKISSLELIGPMSNAQAELKRSSSFQALAIAN